MEETFPRGKKRVYDEPAAKSEKIPKRDPIKNDDGLDNLFSEKPEEKLKLGSDGQSTLKKKIKKKPDTTKGKTFDRDTKLKSGKKDKIVAGDKKFKPVVEKVEDNVGGSPSKYDRNVLPGTLLIGEWTWFGNRRC